MARTFRFYEKKRGHRRTGSEKLGIAGEAAFFAACFLLGCGGLVALIIALVVPEWRANYEFRRTTCVVCGVRVGEKEGDDGTLYRPEVQIKYQVDGETYRIWTYDIHTVGGAGYSTGRDDAEEALSGFEADKQYVCCYDPAEPSVAVLVRGSIWWVWLSFLVPISFVVIGGGGLLYRLLTWGKSAERRAAIARHAPALDRLVNNVRTRPDFPGIPVPTKVTDSPGTKLAFRLPVVGSQAWALLAWLTACVLWNGTVSVFVAVAVRTFLRGEPDWFLTLFILPFVLIGIGLIGFFFRQLVVATGVGPTLVEISDQPLYPGRRYRLFLSQTGRLKINRMELFLVCDEETTYRHGTDTRTESQRVHQHPLLRREQLEVDGGSPLEAACEVEVPAGAMHSFKSDHNEVAWKILVKGTPARWPGFERSFPVIVYPGPNGEGQK